MRRQTPVRPFTFPQGIPKLFSAFHSACNPVNVIASCRNAGIPLHLDARMLMCHVDIEECCCLLGQVDLFSTSAQADVAEPPGEMNESREATVPLWLQILDEKAAPLLDEDHERLPYFDNINGLWGVSRL
jgi:hypothetical protein